MAIDLDDPHRAVVFIPFDGEDSALPQLCPSSSTDQQYELENSALLRWEAYSQAWMKCLNRVTDIIQELHTPIVSEIFEQVKTAYSDALSGLPYTELPTITITNPYAGPSFLSRLSYQLDPPDRDDIFDSEPAALIVEVNPSDFPNITTGMTNLITSFIKKYPMDDNTSKRRAVPSVANYDIELLQAWYTAYREANRSNDEHLPNLVVLFHDFEQFDTLLMQDVLHVCSRHVPQLPLVFLLSLSSPLSTSYLHLAYPTSTISLLRIHQYSVPFGSEVLGRVILQTFWSPNFEPDIIIGPRNLQYLAAYTTRYNPSLDCVMTILQIMHLKHFAGEPLTVLTHSTLSEHDLSRPFSFSFLEHLSLRLCAHQPPEAAQSPEIWRRQDLPSIVASVDDARLQIRTRARRMRISFGVLLHTQCFLRELCSEGQSVSKNGHLLEEFVQLLRGRLEKDLPKTAKALSQLNRSRTGTLLATLREYFQMLPEQARLDEADAELHVEQFIAEAAESLEDLGEHSSTLAKRVSDWLMAYFGDRLLVGLEIVPLWEIWYTGLNPFPAELLNPSTRASVLSGLLRPHNFVTQDQSTSDERALWEYPDASILFQRYLDSGKMINVYDWFQSFQLALETQRRQAKSIKRKGEKRSSRKGKAKAKDDDDEGDTDGETWKLQVQARFVRALHELDYLGFLKHTGRKADHVTRTVFDVRD